LKDPGVLLKDPGVLLKDPGVLLKDPGVLEKDPGVLLKDPGVSLVTSPSTSPNLYRGGVGRDRFSGVLGPIRPPGPP